MIRLETCTICGRLLLEGELLAALGPIDADAPVAHGHHRCIDGVAAVLAAAGIQLLADATA